MLVANGGGGGSYSVNGGGGGYSATPSGSYQGGGTPVSYPSPDPADYAPGGTWESGQVSPSYAIPNGSAYQGSGASVGGLTPTPTGGSSPVSYPSSDPADYSPGGAWESGKVSPVYVPSVPPPQTSPSLVLPYDYGVGQSGFSPSYADPTQYQVPSQVPYPPMPTCLKDPITGQLVAGDRLWKFDTGLDASYFYAPSGLTTKEIKDLYGLSGGFATVVMPKEAFLEGQTDWKEVTTEEGTQVQVPWNPEREAEGEYIFRYGPPKDFTDPAYREAVSDIAAQIREGTYTSWKDLPMIQSHMSQYGLDPVSSLMEIKRITGSVQGAMEGGPGGMPYGYTDSQAQTAVDWLRASGQVAAADAVAQDHLGRSVTTQDFIERSELYGIGTLGKMGDFREGLNYDLPGCLAANVCTQDELVRAGFPEGAVATAAAAALVLPYSTVESAIGAGIPLATLALATGIPLAELENIKERSPQTILSSEDLDTGYAMGAYDPSKGFQPYVPDAPTAWERFKSWWGVPVQGLESYGTLKDFRTLEVTPGLGQMTRLQVGAAIAAPFAITGAALGGAYVLPWALKPVSIGWGPPAVAKGLTGLATTAKLVGVGTALTSTGALVYGATTSPIDPQEKFETLSASSYYAQMREEYLSDAAREYDSAVRGAEVEGKYVERDRESWLAEQDKAFDQWLYERVLDSPEYKPGITGTFHTGVEGLLMPVVDSMADWHPVPKTIVGGYYSLMAPATITHQLREAGVGRSAYAAMIPWVGATAVAPFITPGTPTWRKVLGVGVAASPFIMGAAGHMLGQLGKPISHGPFPKDIIAYDASGKVMVNLPGYGWRSYSHAMQILKQDVGLAQQFQPPTIFGAQPGFWPSGPQPGVLTPRGFAHPSLGPTAPRVWYPGMGQPTLTGPPIIPTAPGQVVPFRFYADTAGPSPWLGTQPIRSIPIGGEAPGVGLTQLVGLGGMVRAPSLTVHPSMFPSEGPVHIGWAGAAVGMPKGLEHYAVPSDFGFGRGGVATLAPTLPQLGAPAVRPLTTGTMTEASMLRELQALGLVTTQTRGVGIPLPLPGVYPSPITTVGPSIYPSITPGVTPIPIQQLVTPGLTPSEPPSLAVAPSTYPYTYPYPYPTPTPTPIMVPTPIPTLFTPVPYPETPPLGTPPPIVPPFGFPGLPGLGSTGAKPRGGRRGIGGWGFMGFPVSAPHPLTLKIVGYDWMKGREIPYGLGQKVPTVRSRSRVGVVRDEGLVRVAA